jgi:2,4-dienoyl-CoA reductase (NADPH2)
VVVVGGGPAGMEAARIAAERGHAVVLLEQDDALGGQVRLAANGPHRTEIGQVVDFRAGELARLDVDVRIRRTATPQVVMAERPDAVVVATGAVIAVDSGITTHPGARVITVADVLRAEAGTTDGGNRFPGLATAAVIDDGRGFWDSISAAELLAERGLHVVLVTPARHVAAGVPAESFAPLHRRLLRAGVAVRAMSTVKEIRPGVVLVDERNLNPSATGIPAEVPADLVVRTGPRRAQDDLLRALEGQVPELHGAGDCLTPRGISQAVTEGHRIGRLL